mmetsp:Transcript_40101/g.126072  ORF Transcript_40101/g.126072 Transcript_40101/m.126072 type:complete len:121 (-) Transcript_40101:1028-1390(-)
MLIAVDEPSLLPFWIDKNLETSRLLEPSSHWFSTHPLASFAHAGALTRRRKGINATATASKSSQTICMKLVLKIFSPGFIREIVAPAVTVTRLCGVQPNTVANQNCHSGNGVSGAARLRR